MMPLQLGGVVGPDFKVYKTANVWVIDASVIPMPLSTHLASVVYAMAMRAAEAIKQG
jgi:choline dehydrogenase